MLALSRKAKSTEMANSKFWEIDTIFAPVIYYWMLSDLSRIIISYMHK